MDKSQSPFEVVTLLTFIVLYIFYIDTTSSVNALRAEVVPVLQVELKFLSQIYASACRCPCPFFLTCSSSCLSGRTFVLHRPRRDHRHRRSRLRLHSPPYTRHDLSEENPIQERLRPGPGFPRRHGRISYFHGDRLHAALDRRGRRRDRVQSHPRVWFTRVHKHVRRGGRQQRRPSAGPSAPDSPFSSPRRREQPGHEERRR